MQMDAFIALIKNTIKNESCIFGRGLSGLETTLLPVMILLCIAQHLIKPCAFIETAQEWPLQMGKI